MLQVFDYAVHVFDAEIELIKHIILFFSLFPVSLDLLDISFSALFIILDFFSVLGLDVALEVIKNLRELFPQNIILFCDFIKLTF